MVVTDDDDVNVDVVYYNEIKVQLLYNTNVDEVVLILVVASLVIIVNGVFYYTLPKAVELSLKHNALLVNNGYLILKYYTKF